jgi:multicomponent Na+:H+ antiporter subunit G
MHTVLTVASGVLLTLGSIFLLTGAVGLLRFPDFYTRIHAGGIAETVGAGFILLGLLVRPDDWSPSVAVRLLVILAFLVLTSPTATHVLAQAARRDGVPVWEEGDGPQ